MRNYIINVFRRGIVGFVVFSSIIPPFVIGPTALPTAEIVEDFIQTAQSAVSPIMTDHARMVTTITAYSSTPDQTDSTPFVTAANTRVRDGIVASNFLPLYTRIQIPELFGDKVFIVEDRMHRRFSDRVDIWFETRDAAKRFGKRTAEIVILPGSGYDPRHNINYLAMK